ncbi:MAG TPA: hypothetical protein DCS66_14785 [Flavobacteriaceae bacterium]|nr:hypothetical protein [Flavobacteriaceae bacterium]|tara:strand:+ start:1239 stop:1784 length:546 start_codon:yes stop_codon:yes gene_type:complete
MDGVMDRYIVVKNFLEESERKLLSTYGKIYIRNNITQFDFQDGASCGAYADWAFESILGNKHKLMEEKTKLKLFPTYSFFRIYNKYSVLKKHKDRPACEISVTVSIDSCKTFEWPIYLDGEKILLDPGDAVIYKGCDLWHWRDEFLGDWHHQCFLHYVNAEGPHREWALDKRRVLGQGEHK